MPSARILADAPRWVHTGAFGLPAAWHLAIPLQGQPHRWWFPHRQVTEFAVTFGADPQAEITPPAAHDPGESLDAQFAQDPLGTVVALLGRMPCPAGTAALLFAMSGDGPLEFRRGTGADIEALLNNLERLGDEPADAIGEAVGHG